MNGINESAWPSPDMAQPTAAPRRVSADSFRRLTSLLKKLEPITIVVPDLAPVVIPLPVIAAPVEVAITPAPLQPELVAEPAIIVPDAPIEIPPTPIEMSPSAVEMQATLPEEIPGVEVLAEPAPIVAETQLNIPEPPAAEPLQSPMPEALSAPVAEPVQPPAVVQVQPSAAVPVPPLRAATSLLRRQPKRDIFDEIPTVPKTKVLEQLSPAQDAEQSELARSLIDMMSGAGAGGGQPHERALAADTLLRMLPRLSQSIRVVLAQRLSMMDTPPSFLVSRLLVDQDVTVSGPLLEDCMQIADEDLFPVIDQGNQEQLRMIARRRRLSRAVTEALVAGADVSVLLTLVRNAAAEIPQDGFAELARVASENPELLAPLCIRQDLPIHTAFELFWSAPVQLRRYLLTRFLTDSENLTRILRITMKGEEGGTTSISVEDVGAGLLQALAGQTDEAAMKVAAAVKVTPATIERIFADSSGEAMMALLKVAGISRAELATNLPNFVAGEHALIDPSRNFEELQAVFDQLSYTKARILLTYWDWASNKSGPYATHH
ncbi:MAG TPA: DUF2336 domain-containing protein [Aestuariivirga sp.]